MKNRKYLGSILICLMVMLMLAGCDRLKSIQIDTTMTIDSQFSGERVIKASIDSRTFKAFFNEDIIQLENMLNQYSPASIYCFVEEDKSEVSITAVIVFASYKDYVQKIEEALADNDNFSNPSVYYETSDTLFKNGFSLEENFTSLDLLYWLETGLTTEYDLELPDDTMSLFELHETQLVADGQTFTSDDHLIKASTMESHAFKTIRSEITVNDNKTYDVRVEMVCPLDIAGMLGSNLTRLMNGLTPDEGSTRSIQEDDEKTFIYEFSANSEEDFIKKMNQVLKAENTSLIIADENDETDTLKAQRQITLYLDGSYFLDYSNETTVMSTRLKASPEYSFEDCTSTYQYLEYYESDHTEDYCSIDIVVSLPDEITVSLGFSVDIERIEIDTRILHESEMTRSLKFILTKDQDEIIGASLIERIESKLGDQITYERTTSDTRVQYEVSISAASAEELSNLTTYLLDSSQEKMSSSLDGGKVAKKSMNKVRYEYNDTINFMNFLGGAQASKGITYQLSYPKGFNASFDEGANYEEASTQGNTISCVTYNKTIDVTSFADRANYIGVFLKTIWIISLLGLIALLITNLGVVMAFVKTKSLDEELSRFANKRGYITLGMAAILIVVFIVSTIRILFKIY